jgi:hypothetical protein
VEPAGPGPGRGSGLRPLRFCARGLRAWCRAVGFESSLTSDVNRPGRLAVRALVTDSLAKRHRDVTAGRPRRRRGLNPGFQSRIGIALALRDRHTSAGLGTDGGLRRGLPAHGAGVSPDSSQRGRTPGIPASIQAWSANMRVAASVVLLLACATHLVSAYPAFFARVGQSADQKARGRLTQRDLLAACVADSLVGAPHRRVRPPAAHDDARPVPPRPQRCPRRRISAAPPTHRSGTASTGPPWPIREQRAGGRADDQIAPPPASLTTTADAQRLLPPKPVSPALSWLMWQRASP